MPYEIRSISLSDDELFQAIDLFQRLHPLELPLGDLAAVRVHEGQIEATLRPSKDSSARSIITFKPAMAVRTMVDFCLHAKIPLPREADKTFCIENGRATLMIKLVTGKAARTEHFAADHSPHGRANRVEGSKSPANALADLMVEIETRTDGPTA